MYGDLSSEVVHCPNCNEDVPKTLYCLNCGYPLYKIEQEEKAKVQPEAEPEALEVVVPEDTEVDMSVEIEQPEETFIVEEGAEAQPEVEPEPIQEPELEPELETEPEPEMIPEEIETTIKVEEEAPPEKLEPEKRIEEVAEAPIAEPLPKMETEADIKVEEEEPEMEPEVEEPQVVKPKVEDKPVIEELKVEAAEEPQVEEPIIEEPEEKAVEEPRVEEPKVEEEPVIEEPEEKAVEEPRVEEPRVEEEPVIEKPEEEAPPPEAEEKVIMEPEETEKPIDYLEEEPELMEAIRLEFAPDPLTKEVMENLAKNITLKIRLVRLLRDGQVKEETFKKLFDSYVEQGRIWVSRRDDSVRRFKADIERMEEALVTARKDFELLEIRRNIGDADDEEYKVKAPAYNWDIEHLEEEIKNRKGGILYVGNLRKLVPEGEIVELEKMADTDYVELDGIEGISAETVAKMKETLAESLNILNS
jgi:hypothetical protein